jgi:hypothetical protein
MKNWLIELWYDIKWMVQGEPRGYSRFNHIIDNNNVVAEAYEAKRAAARRYLATMQTQGHVHREYGAPVHFGLEPD